MTIESTRVWPSAEPAAPSLSPAPEPPAPEPPAPEPPAPDPAPAGPRKATRVAEGAMLGGVCTGLARHLGWPVMVIRIGFVALLITQLLGVIAYGALWLLMPPAIEPTKAPGIEAASRGNKRDAARGAGRSALKSRRRMDVGALVALMALGAGLLWLVQLTGWGISQSLFWPIAFACAGAALVWRQADTAQQREWRAEAGGRLWLAPFVARGGWPAVVRVVLGLGLIGGAFAVVIAQYQQLAQLPAVLALTGLALAGVAIVVAPWLYRSRTTLNQVRAEKVRADARADMAAHLHDSVLQTLALIQRQADDPKAVQQLARRQERELRGWLYGDELADTTVKAALTQGASDIEDERGVPVELVVVGDADLNESLGALVRAAREAMMNAAKHADVDKIDVYAEIDEDHVEVFVRDRGRGFDLGDIDDDRMGVRGSIVDRMARHGGRAVIRTAPGEGTEVKLEMQR
ncbi:MAG: ATP-binding protein [Propionibacteriaceae bacterium]